MSFTGKRIVITGAAGDFGRAVTRRLLAGGAEVFAVGQDSDSLETLTKDLGSLGRLTTYVADVRDEAQVAGYANAARQAGPIDGFFNNAGIQIPAVPITDTAVEDFDRVFAVNVRGIFLGLKHVLPLMADGGSVVNSSSALGVVGAPGVAAYSSAKHAIIGLTKVAALEQGPRNIRVNAIAPGPIAGRMTFTLEEQVFQGSGQTFSDSAPIKRHGQPDEVAALVLFLLSDDARYISGSVQVQDGGYTAA